jgi:hypothetical protein
VRLSVTGILTRISGEHDRDALEKEFLHLIADQALIPVVMEVFGEGGGEAKPVVGLPYGDGAKSGGKFPSVLNVGRMTLGGGSRSSVSGTSGG